MAAPRRSCAWLGAWASSQPRSSISQRWRAIFRASFWMSCFWMSCFLMSCFLMSCFLMSWQPARSPPASPLKGSVACYSPSCSPRLSSSISHSAAASAFAGTRVSHSPVADDCVPLAVRRVWTGDIAVQRSSPGFAAMAEPRPRDDSPTKSLTARIYIQATSGWFTRSHPGVGYLWLSTATGWSWPD